MTERKIQNYLIGRKREIEVLTDYFYEAYFSGFFFILFKVHNKQMGNQKIQAVFSKVQIKDENVFFFTFICVYFMLNLFPHHKFLFLQFFLGCLFLQCTLLFWL